MNRRLGSSGYTIIEVMIVLAISGALLISTMATINGQQRRTEYTTAVRELESKLEDIFNDVESGYLANNGTTRCTSTPTGEPVVSGSGAPGAVIEQGTNQDCIFLGKAIQFYEDSGGLVTNYRAYGIAGKRQYVDAGKVKDVTNIDNAEPTAFYDAGSGPGNSFDAGQLRFGLQVRNIIYQGSPAISRRGGVAVMSAIGAGGTAAVGEKAGTNIPASDGGARLAVLDLNSVADEFPAPTTAIGTAMSSLSSTSINNAQNGVVICLDDGPGGRQAAITIGVRYDEAEPDPALRVTASGQRLSTEAYFDQNATGLGC
jgi:prepilin-type N-terminal cleavage/methylation domain-containing protein